MTRLTLDLTDEVNNRLTEIATTNGITKSEAMRRALSLLSVADKEQRKGNTLAVVKEEGNKITPVARLVGVL